MISVPAGVRVLLATRPVDFRKGAHGLAALAAEVLGQEPFSVSAALWPFFHWDGRMCLDVLGLGCSSYRYG